MTTLHLIFIVAFLICEVIASIGVNSRVNLVAAGLACLGASMLF